MEVLSSSSSLRVFLYSSTLSELITCTTHSCQTLSHPVAIPYCATVIRVNSRRGPNLHSFEIAVRQNNISTFSSNTKESTMYLSMLYWKKKSLYTKVYYVDYLQRFWCWGTCYKLVPHTYKFKSLPTLLVRWNNWYLNTSSVCLFIRKKGISYSIF